MVEKQDMVVMDLLNSGVFYLCMIYSMLHGGRVLVFNESDITMDTYIRQEDGSIERQQPSRKITPMQEKCDY